MGKLVAVSAADGRVLWQQPYSNYQLVLRDDGLYALSGQVGAEVGMDGQFRPDLSNTPEPSRKFDPLTGEILAEFQSGTPCLHAADRRDRRGVLPRQRWLDASGRRRRSSGD